MIKFKQQTQRQATPTVKINKIYMQLDKITGRYVVVYGGRRSSKSYSISQLLVKKAMENPGRLIVCMRKVATTIRLSIWPRILNAIEETGMLSLCDINKTDKVIELPNGSAFIFVGADDPQKLKSLEGATDYWLEEANEFDEIDLDTIDAGLSANVYPECQIYLTFNPVPILEDYVPWIAQRFIVPIEHDLGQLVRKGEIVLLQTYYKHNAFCPPATIKLLESYKESNPPLYDLWALGKYTRLEGVIFNNWDTVDSVPYDAKDNGYGLDFGFTVDPSTLIHIWTREASDGIMDVYLKEELYEIGLNNFSLARAMKECGVERYDEVVADSAEPKSIDELCTLGLNIYPADKGPDSIRAGIMQMQAMRLHVIKGSTNLVKELSTYCWKKNKDGKEIPVPVDKNNHAIDAARYRLYNLNSSKPCPELGSALAARRRAV